MKGVTYWLSKEFLIGDLRRSPILFAFADPTEESVVRPDKEMAGTLNDNRAPIRADAWIDYGDVGRFWGEVAITTQQVESSGFDVLWRDLVGDINDCRLWANR